MHEKWQQMLWTDESKFDLAGSEGGLFAGGRDSSTIMSAGNREAWQRFLCKFGAAFLQMKRRFGQDDWCPHF